MPKLFRFKTKHGGENGKRTQAGEKMIKIRKIKNQTAFYKTSFFKYYFCQFQGN